MVVAIQVVNYDMSPVAEMVHNLGVFSGYMFGAQVTSLFFSDIVTVIKMARVRGLMLHSTTSS